MTEIKCSTQQIEILKANGQDDDNFLQLLDLSLQQASKVAQEQLDPELYKALKWPKNWLQYIEYLAWFANWIPHQSNNDAWLKPGSDEHQEVYDHLCHFYWLIDQKVGPKGKIVESIPWFSNWLREYANVWGSFLNTTESFNQQVLDSFIKLSPKFTVEESMVNGKPNAPSGWLTFNQFFARELNPGVRPITSPFDNKVVTCPADCTYKAHYKIGPDSRIPEITVKKTHKFANVEDLLQESEYKSVFANGTFIHYFLGPYSYHRFHTPVAGILRECYPVRGLVYLDVEITGSQFNAPDSSQGGYEFSQARGVVTIDTKNSPYGDIGIVGIVPIGMCQVSSVNMTAKPGSNVLKGDEFGYFLFGGSDIIVLLQEGVDPLINTSSDYHNYGSWIAKRW
jgi:phosphatidylserine decarboxylase